MNDDLIKNSLLPACSWTPAWAFKFYGLSNTTLVQIFRTACIHIQYSYKNTCISASRVMPRQISLWNYRFYPYAYLVAQIWKPVVECMYCMHRRTDIPTISQSHPSIVNIQIWSLQKEWREFSSQKLHIRGYQHDIWRQRSFHKPPCNARRIWSYDGCKRYCCSELGWFLSNVVIDFLTFNDLSWG